MVRSGLAMAMAMATAMAMAMATATATATARSPSPFRLPPAHPAERPREGGGDPALGVAEVGASGAGGLLGRRRGQRPPERLQPFQERLRERPVDRGRARTRSKCCC